MRQRGGLRLNCFSPPVMLATFALEVCLALYTLWRYRMSVVTRLVVALLVLLAMFQLAEYMVCGGLGMSAAGWARLGYVAITLLPALGIHLAFALAGKSNRLVVTSTYILAVWFIGYFLFASDAFAGNQCMGNYVIFQLSSVAARLYTWYYYGLLVLGIGMSLHFMGGAKGKSKRALLMYVIGYALFMIPTTVVNTVDPSTVAGIPSIMCGFAVSLALVLSLLVVPLAAKTRVK